MALSDNQKVDFLWKKIIFGVSDTDLDSKEGFNETIASPVPTYAGDIWTNSAEIPVPADTLVDVTEYLTYQCTADPTVSGNKAWLATSTFGNIATQVGDWVPTTFDPAYLVFVYDGDPDGGGSSLNQGTANEEWVFDYVSGTLTFPNNIPGGLSEIWIRAYRYIGGKGVAGSVTVSKTYADITARDSDSEVAAGQFAQVTDAGDGEYAIYVANAAGPTSDWTLVSTEDAADTDAKSLQGTVTNASGAETTLGNASQGTRVINVSVEVTTPFDGTPTLTVGIDGDDDVLLTNDDIDLSGNGIYEASSTYVFTNTVDTDVKAFFTDNGATAGSANIIVSFL